MSQSIATRDSERLLNLAIQLNELKASRIKLHKERLLNCLLGTVVFLAVGIFLGANLF